MDPFDTMPDIDDYDDLDQYDDDFEKWREDNDISMTDIAMSNYESDQCGRFSQPEYCMPHSIGSIKNRTDLFSGFWERPVLRKQTLRFQKTM